MIFDDHVQLTGNHDSGPVPENVDIDSFSQFRILKARNFTLNCKRRADNVIITKQYSIYRIDNILRDNNLGTTFLAGRIFCKGKCIRLPISFVTCRNL